MRTTSSSSFGSRNIAYDANDPRVIDNADTSTTRIVPNLTAGRLMRGPSGTSGLYDNGRVFRVRPCHGQRHRL